MGLMPEGRDRRAVELLKKLDLGNKLANRPNELSGGQQQRVSIARALMNGGEIILADEPTGALDSKSGEMVMDIIKGLHKQGHTIILVTHDSHIAAQASRIIEIKDGEIVSDERRAEDFYEETDTVDIMLDFFEENEDGTYERTSEDFSERAYSLDELSEWLGDAGFDIENIYDGMTNEPVREDSERAVIAARRRK